MPKAKLTKTYIDNIVPPAKEYELHWDTEEKGFALRVTPRGSMSYVLIARIKGGRQCDITIGRHGTWTPDLARKEAKELRREMDRGIDPRKKSEEEEARKVTLKQISDAYIRDRPLKESSAEEIKRHVATTLEPWKDKPIASITRPMVTSRFNHLKAKGVSGRGPAPAHAAQAMIILRALVNYAIREYRKPDGAPIIVDNPVHVMHGKMPTPKPRTSRIPDKKVGAVWNDLQAQRAAATTREVLNSVDLVTLLLLTGMRLNEGRSLRWDQVSLDQEDPWIHLPDPKNGNEVWLPLSTQARELLATRQRVKGSPYVFPSWSKSGHIQTPRDTLNKVSNVSGVKITAHDLRRSFTTIGVAHCGIDVLKVELLTNHIPQTVTAKSYLETSHLQYLRPDVQKIADYIEEQGRVAAGSNVVPLRA